MELTELMRRRFAVQRFAPMFEISDDILAALSRSTVVNLIAKQSTFADTLVIQYYMDAPGYIIPSKGLVR